MKYTITFFVLGGMVSYLAVTLGGGGTGSIGFLSVALYCLRDMRDSGHTSLTNLEKAESLLNSA